MKEMKVKYGYELSQEGKKSKDYMTIQLPDGRELYAEVSEEKENDEVTTFEKLWLTVMLQVIAEEAKESKEKA